MVGLQVLPSFFHCLCFSPLLSLSFPPHSHARNKIKTHKQTNKQRDKQANKQTNKQLINSAQQINKQQVHNKHQTNNHVLLVLILV
jgi:hypothetical protein